MLSKPLVTGIYTSTQNYTSLINIQETINDENNWINIFISGDLGGDEYFWISDSILSPQWLWKTNCARNNFEIKKQLNLFQLVTNNKKASSLSFKLD